MNRLTSGMVGLLAVALVGACSGDPTSDLRNGVSVLTASPSTLNVTLGKNKTTQITAVDEQGNTISSAFEVTDIGPGITVKRDSTYLPIYLSDSTLSVPPEAPTFQYVVTATDLVASHFTVAVGDKSVTIPVFVGPDPLNIPISTISSTGPTAEDPTVITAPAGYNFSPTATVAFDVFTAITLGVSADGTQLTVLPPPGAASKGIVSGLFAPSNTQVTVSDSTDVPVAIAPGSPAGSDDPNTAPNFDAPAIGGLGGFWFGDNWGGADITGDGGLGAQYRKITLAEDADVHFVTNWNNDADIDMLICFDPGCNDGAFLGSGSDQPEEDTITLTAGTYYFAAVLFDVGASATNPTAVSVTIDAAAPTPAIKQFAKIKHK